MNPLDKIREKLSIGACYRRVFSTEDGIRVLDHLMREGFMTTPTFVAGDPEQTNLNEGSRRLVLSILRQVYRDDGKLQDHLRKAIEDEESK